MTDLSVIRAKSGFICDMDGVLYHGPNLLPGAQEFVDWLKRENKQFLFLTNASGSAPRELRAKLLRMGLDVGEEHFYTSALATALFLSTQAPGCSAYVIGAPGLLNALYEAGITMNDTDPDYVVVGETNSYTYDTILKACELINKGAKLVATNTDLTAPTEKGIIPACRALVSPISLATGRKAYFVGKPNPLIMRSALRRLGVHSNEAVMIGDNMETDMIAGLESGLDTVLVLSGLTRRENLKQYSYCPSCILDGVGQLVPGFGEA